MKKLTFLILFLLINSVTPAQNSIKKTDSYTILRLLVFNTKGKVLLEKNRNGWMTPAIRHNNNDKSINESLQDLAFNYGLDITTPTLLGLFTFNFDYKKTSSFRSHYSAKYVSGDLELPQYVFDAKWFSINKAIEMMSLPDTKASFAIRDMTRQILQHPKTIWGGTFILTKDQQGSRSYKLSEDFYPLFSHEEKIKDNYTIQRLIIKNDKNEILIYKGKSYWMTPALRHNKELSIKEGLQQLAKSYGLTISLPKLAGLYTYKFGFKNGVSFRSFYTADLIGNSKVTPPAPITQVKWVPVSDAMKSVGGLNVRKQMLNHVLQHPETLWGGSFYLYDDEQGVRKVKVLEEFYSLR